MRSAGQSRLWGLIKSVQNGSTPLSAVDDKVRTMALKSTPKDATQVKIGDQVKTAMAIFAMIKQADVRATVRKADQALRQVNKIRTKGVEDHSKQLRKSYEQLQKQMQTSQMASAGNQQELQNQLMQSQAAMSSPPAGQPPFGIMAQQMAMQEAGTEKSKPTNFLQGVPKLPGQNVARPM